MKKIVFLKALLFTSLAMAFSPELEKITQELDGHSSHIDGANCWNGALYSLGVVKARRFMHPEEWLIHIKRNCQEVAVPEHGDLGRIFLKKAEEASEEVHGFVHLDENTIFAKHGESAMHGYQIMSYEEMLTQYGKTRNCRMSGSDEPECYHAIKYYHCRNREDARSYNRLEKLLEVISFSDETKWKYKSTCEDSNFIKREELLNEALTLGEEIKVELEKETPHFRSALVESLKQQVFNIEVSNRNFRCKPRNVKYDTIRKVRKMLDSFIPPI